MKRRRVIPQILQGRLRAYESIYTGLRTGTHNLCFLSLSYSSFRKLIQLSQAYLAFASLSTLSKGLNWSLWAAERPALNLNYYHPPCAKDPRILSGIELAPDTSLRSGKFNCARRVSLVKCCLPAYELQSLGNLKI